MSKSIKFLLILGLILQLFSGCVLPTPIPFETNTPPTSSAVPLGTLSPLPQPTQTGSSQQGNLQVHFIDVGQGDSILIQSPDGKNMLIDGGERTPGVLNYLNKQGIKQIDVMIATHPHSDHIGGLVDVLRQIKVLEVWTNGQPHTTKTFEDFLVGIDKSGAKYREAKRGDAIELGILRFQVLHPGPRLVDDMNRNSVVLRLVYGDVSFLFTGDANGSAETEILAAKQEVKATILKVGHHGSATSSSAAFLKAVSPKAAGYSAGVGNSYGHPAASTLARLKEAGATVYGTDVNGTIIVVTDGKTYSIKLEKQTSSRAPPVTATQLTIPTAIPLAPVPSIAPLPSAVVPAPTGELYLDIILVTSPVRPGATASLKARTVSGAKGMIAVYYKSGRSTAAGLDDKVADSNGDISWTWKVGTRTTPGSWPIIVTASNGGKTTSQTTNFTVQ